MRDAPAPAPLTHHEIVALAAPFTRQGFAVDLAACDRAARRIAFRPQSLGDGLSQKVFATEADDGWRVERHTSEPGGAQALATAAGDELSALADRLAALPAAGGFERGEGWLIAWHQRLPAAGPPLLAGASLQLDGLQMAMTLSPVDRIPAEVTVHAPAGDIASLPSDLLAVLGLPWARLERKGTGWRSTLNVGGRGAARSAQAMAQWRAAAKHLARTLAEPPARFHERHAARRWGVTLRRAVPLLACLGVIGAALSVPAMKLSEDSVFRMLIFNAPPLLLGLLFAFREMPRIELPPPPQRLTAPAWRQLPAREER